MAKAKSELNRSEAIREAIKAMPNAKAKEVVAHLKEKGIEVSEQLVYQVKKVAKKKKPGRRPATTAQVKAVPVKAPVAASSNGHLSMGAAIALVRSTADKVGGYAALKEIVEALQ
jgi:hypothetical protein